VMRKLAAATARTADADEQLAEWHQQIEDWHTDTTRADRREVAWATGLLQQWAIEAREGDPDAKTLHLPSGRVATRWVPAHPEVRDPGAVAELLARTDHPAYDHIVRAEVRVDASQLAAATQLADEYLVTLSCGCQPTTWHLADGHRPDLDVGPWPWRPEEHTHATEPPDLTATSIDPGRRARSFYRAAPARRSPRCRSTAAPDTCQARHALVKN